MERIEVGRSWWLSKYSVATNSASGLGAMQKVCLPFGLNLVHHYAVGIYGAMSIR